MGVSNHLIENKLIFYIFHISCIGFIVCYSLLDFLEPHVDSIVFVALALMVASGGKIQDRLTLPKIGGPAPF